MTDTLTRLEAIIAERQTGDASASYVARLFAKGLPEIARKVGEEGVEAAVAALSGSPDDLRGEAADLVFHLLVLLRARGVSFADVCAELDRREGVGGLVEKAARKDA